MHSNQCLWFEQVCGAQYYKLGDYQKSLKEFSYSIQHMTDMIEEQYDYYQYACGRAVTFHALEQLLNIQNAELHKFKSVVKSAIGLCKLGVKISKIREAEIARFKPILDEYTASDEYKAVLKQVDEAT